MALIKSWVTAAVLVLLALLLPAAAEVPPPPDNCTAVCGNVNVTYPFGLGSEAGCFWPGLNLTCADDDTRSGGKRLLLGDGSLQVTEISVDNGTVRVVRTGDIQIDRYGHGAFGGGLRDHGPYTMSSGNELVVVGCNVYASLLEKNDDNMISGCASFCPDDDHGRAGQRDQAGKYYCNGMGCCRATIVETRDDVAGDVEFSWLGPPKDRSRDDAPRVFVAVEGWFDQRPLYGNANLTSTVAVPVLLNWVIVDVEEEDRALVVVVADELDCNKETTRRICKSKDSRCKMRGRDINKCANKGAQGCVRHDENKDPNTGLAIGLGVGSGVGIIVLILIVFFMVRRFKHKRARKLKHRFFLQNRGQLLQQLVSQRADIAERMIITLEELEKATNNFDKSREIGGGGHGTVYKGILSDLHVVAIKKPKLVVQKEIDDFINEVAILSQVKHKNVVKLYGCCLETEVPLLVYEFISNGTLYDHLHDRSLSWGDRLRIAIQTAKSLAYLHFAVSIPIIHRDIKSVNILLDDTLTAKVADFGASRYIPMGKSGVTTMVQGTIGYLDPMYFYTSRLTDKSDVYSFGVILVELLTRRKPFSYITSKGDSLVANFVTLHAEGNLSQILDPRVIEEGGKEVEGVAALAVACVKLKGEDRPTMRQVELTLESLQTSRDHVSQVVGSFGKDDRAMNFPSTNDGRNIDDSTSRQDSLEEEFMLSTEYPR
ncbi:wall-associated receptor kinase 3-like [Lolium rigidum]|uniref:wall-associated receptor kinase 3-like n=1 Tax=Lolium rigidum TaxID=89674 RepID=UPI001F5D3749|nr:wall-associated receptor kinase 3-like [Lolium rigidum]